jgi:hypothetical protein
LHLPTFSVFGFLIIQGAYMAKSNQPSQPRESVADMGNQSSSQSNQSIGNEATADLQSGEVVLNGTERRERSFLKSMPSWMISMVVHTAAIITLAAVHLEPIKKELKLILSSSEALDSSESLDVAESVEVSSESLEPVEAESPAPAVAVEAVMTETSSLVVPEVVVAAPSISMPSVSQSLAPSSGLSVSANDAIKAALKGRSKEAKRDLLKKFGGSDATEKAVALALKWLADRQNKQTGAWSLAHGPDNPGKRLQSYNAATGLALMCFLGAGQTHLEGEYKETVFMGLSFLIRNIKPHGGYLGWYVGGGGQGPDDMYSHGIATIALCEAYGMTKDLALLEAAQAGINFLTYAQNPDTGGWHYGPKGRGDTSVVGWQMMALKSASMAGIAVDLSVVRKANFFLDQMAWDGGTSYHYDFNSVSSGAGYNPSCTACALLCRMYSGLPKDNDALKGIIAKFDSTGPSSTNTYYNYYATQVMKQVGGTEWDRWNEKMRDQLLGMQMQTGPSAGSWYWNDGHSTEQGGRFYTTCMATMILEVYYRYLPIYSEQKEEDAFQL